jgi:hypothetical protein
MTLNIQLSLPSKSSLEILNMAGSRRSIANRAVPASDKHALEVDTSNAAGNLQASGRHDLYCIVSEKKLY